MKIKYLKSIWFWMMAVWVGSGFFKEIARLEEIKHDTKRIRRNRKRL